MSLELVILAYVAIGLSIALAAYSSFEQWAGLWEDYFLVLVSATLWLPLCVAIVCIAFLGWLLEHKDWRVLR